MWEYFRVHLRREFLVKLIFISKKTFSTRKTGKRKLVLNSPKNKSMKMFNNTYCSNYEAVE